MFNLKKLGDYGYPNNIATLPDGWKMAIVYAIMVGSSHYFSPLILFPNMTHGNYNMTNIETWIAFSFDGANVQYINSTYGSVRTDLLFEVYYI